jgi:LCP family protein required for cell wall assembly
VTSFTILILGADSEGRTDAVMVAGVDVVARRVRFASIPRDTIDLPLPNGTIFRNQKVNAFWNMAASHPASYPEGPDRAMANAVGNLLGIRIDYYARTSFGGFSSLIDTIGGIPITLPHIVHDDFLQVGPSTFGITFPAGKQVLDGRKGLAFVRIRHADNDFERQRRQQAFLAAAGLFALQQPDGVQRFVAAAKGRVATDFPIDALGRYRDALAGIDASAISGVVLGPRTYERAASCPCGYALEPLVDAMRREARQLFPWATDG